MYVMDFKHVAKRFPHTVHAHWLRMHCQWYPMGDVRTHNSRTDRCSFGTFAVICTDAWHMSSFYWGRLAYVTMKRLKWCTWSLSRRHSSVLRDCFYVLFTSSSAVSELRAVGYAGAWRSRGDWSTSYGPESWASLLTWLPDWAWHVYRFHVLYCWIGYYEFYVSFVMFKLLHSYNYSAKKLKLRRVLQTLCGAFERCSRVRL